MNAFLRRSKCGSSQSLSRKRKIPKALTFGKFLLDIGARGRGRTGTRGKPRGILSPVRLPIPPPGHDKYNCIEHRAKVKLDLAIR